MNPLRGSKRCWALVFKCDTYIYEDVVTKILFDCYAGDVLFSGINDNRNNQQSKAIVRSRKLRTPTNDFGFCDGKRNLLHLKLT